MAGDNGDCAELADGARGRQNRAIEQCAGCAPADPAGAARELHRAAVGDRRLRADARGAHPDQRIARRPVRAKRVFVGGVGDLHPRLAPVRARRERPCSTSHARCRASAARRCSQPRSALIAQEFHGSRTRHGDRVLGRDRRRRGRGRPGARRRAHRCARLAVDLLRQPPDRCRRARDRGDAHDERRRPGRERLDFAGLVTFAGSLFLLIFGLLRGNDEGWSSTLIVASLAGAAC